MTNLIDRLRDADGPDRELDAEIVTYSELNERGSPKQSFQIAQDIAEMMGRADARLEHLEIGGSIYLNDYRICGGKPVFGGSEKSRSTKLHHILQAVFSRDELLKIAKGLALLMAMEAQDD